MFIKYAGIIFTLSFVLVCVIYYAGGYIFSSSLRAANGCTGVYGDLGYVLLMGIDRRDNDIGRSDTLMLAAVVLFYAFSYLFAQRHESWFGAAFSFPVEAVLWSAVIIGYLRFPFPNWSWLDRLLAWLGGLSFSLYLFHLPVTFLALKRFGMSYPQSLTEMLQRGVIIIAVTTAYACLTYYTIEKPFNNKRIKYT